MDVPAEIATEAREVTQAAQGFAITTEQENQTVGGKLTAIKALERKIKNFFAPHKAAAHAAHKGLCDAEQRELGPLQEAEAAYKRAIATYETEQERIRRQRAAELTAEARRIEEDERLREATALEAAGETQLAERVLEAPIETPAIVIERPKAPAGIIRTTWRTEVTDKMALVRAVAEGRAEAGLLTVNQSALDGMARSLKGAMSVPGVRVVAEKSVAARRSTALEENEKPF